jgi:hydroxymethylpyrimidine pyrophosphatase-like HAD family hydrolase
MIKAILTDVDGVIVGKKQGVNFPLPTHAVIEKLKKLHQNDLPIILCTAKYHPGVIDLIKLAALHGPHITSGGALVIDPLDKKVLKTHCLDNNLVQQIITTCVENNIYIECYGTENYYVQEKQVFELTKKHAAINEVEPKIVSSLKNELMTTDIIKIEAFAMNKEDIQRVDSFLKKFAYQVNIIWTMHPTILPFQICVIIVNGVSKKAASMEVLDYLKVSPDETLGIGDTLGDWNFMEMCKYVATVGDDSKELKDLVKTKGEGDYFCASSVDEDGILDIFNYFKVK